MCSFLNGSVRGYAAAILFYGSLVENTLASGFMTPALNSRSRRNTVNGFELLIVVLGNLGNETRQYCGV